MTLPSHAEPNAIQRLVAFGHIDLQLTGLDAEPLGDRMPELRLSRGGEADKAIGRHVIEIAEHLMHGGLAVRERTGLAHVVLMEDSIVKVVQAVEISRGAVGLVRQDYAIVVGLNTLALCLKLLKRRAQSCR